MSRDASRSYQARTRACVTNALRAGKPELRGLWLSLAESYKTLLLLDKSAQSDRGIAEPAPAPGADTSEQPSATDVRIKYRQGSFLREVECGSLETAVMRAGQLILAGAGCSGFQILDGKDVLLLDDNATQGAWQRPDDPREASTLGFRE